MRSSSPSPSALLLLVLAILAVQGPAGAFLVQTHDGDDGPVRLRWDSDRVPFILAGAGSADMAPEIAFSAIRQAFDTWASVESSRLQFIDEGVDAGATANRRDRRNVIIFDETGQTLQAPTGTGIIAVTRLNSDVNDGSILDADIIYNGRDFTFSVSPNGSQIDLVDVTVHEVGHFIGLDHTPLGGPPASQPTMNPFYSGSPGAASSLAADDIAGISHLYPTAEFTSSTGTITGIVTDPSGLPIFGAHVVAEAVDGSRISTLTGAEFGSEAPGTYTLRGLPPHDYTIRIEPFAHGISEDSFSGIFTNLATDIATEFFDNVTRADLAQIITVPDGSGRHIGGIDFITGLSLPGYPFVTSLLEPVNTPDTSGPYTVRARVTNAERIEILVETLSRDGQSTAQTIPMIADADSSGEFSAQIRGQSVGSNVQYRIVATGTDTRISYFPGEATWIDFDVVALTGAPLAFAVVRSAGAVRVFDTGSDLEISRITVGGDPIQLVSSTDGRFLFIADLGTSQIVVVERATFQVVDRIDVASAPLDMAVSADGATLYVTNSDTGRLTAIDVDSHTVRDSWVVGQSSAGPYGVATGASGRVYVTDLNADELIVFDQDRVLRRLPTPSSPRTLARSADGTSLFLSSFDTGLFSRIDDATGSVTTTDLGVLGTFAVLAHPTKDQVYLTAHQDDLLLVVEGSTGRVLERIDVGDDPRGLALAPDGHLLYVTSATSDEIHIIDPETASIVGIYSAAGGPRGIAVVESLDSRSTAIDASPQPDSWFLSPLFPNPFNPETQLQVFVGARGGAIRLDVYNILGQRVRRLLPDQLLPAGQQLNVVWDGRDTRGRSLAAGVYVFVLQTPEGQLVRKGLLLR